MVVPPELIQINTLALVWHVIQTVNNAVINQPYVLVAFQLQQHANISLFQIVVVSLYALAQLSSMEITAGIVVLQIIVQHVLTLKIIVHHA
jgi:hypothetical protein